MGALKKVMTDEMEPDATDTIQADAGLIFQKECGLTPVLQGDPLLQVSR
ncbi:MAG TPA: hypothetical protein VIM30_10680 [Candidatus Limnocylindrales bacterium]|jgi:hypothetical protein